MPLVWVAFIIAVFTRSHSKPPCHIVLVFPAVALLIASYLDQATRRARARAVNAALMQLLLLLLGGALPGFVEFMTGLAKRAGEAALYQQYQPLVIAAGPIAPIGGALAMVSNARCAPRRPC